MLGKTWYFALTRKYTTLIGMLFDDIKIIREIKSTNTQTALISVPVTYGPKDKMLARVIQDPDIQRPEATATLPMISFEMGQITYDGTRKLQTTVKMSKENQKKTKMKTQYVPVPYNIAFKAYVYVKNVEDGTKIIEQILPFFTPDWTTPVTLIEEMNVDMDIAVVLNSVTYSDNYSGDFKTRRAVIWEFDMTLKGYYFGPINEQKVIKFVKITSYVPGGDDLYAAVGHTPALEIQTVQPGLTSNGQPTSNISLTIPYIEIQATDPYGFIETITDPQSN